MKDLRGVSVYIYCHTHFSTWSITACCVYVIAMEVSTVNNVKVYNLSAGRSLPEVSRECPLQLLWHITRLISSSVDIGAQEKVSFKRGL